MSATKEYGVFPFDPTNMYRRESAVRIFKRRHAADKMADRMLYEPNYTMGLGLPDVDRGYVVREVL